MARFKHEAFVRHIDAFVDEVDDERFRRAWTAVVACIEAHARVDRRPKESKLMATSRLWNAFARAAQGNRAPPTVVGLLDGLVSACPSMHQWDGSLDQHIAEAIAHGRGNPGFVRWGRPVRRDPLLFLIEGRRARLGDPFE